jgi:hypothetical protein
MSREPEAPGRWPERLYALALRLYPSTFRRRFGDEMMAMFHARRIAAAAGGPFTHARFWRRTLGDLTRSLVDVHRHAPAALVGPLFSAGLGISFRDGLRFLRRSPGLSLAIVLLMAVAIGAATADTRHA